MPKFLIKKKGFQCYLTKTSSTNATQKIDIDKVIALNTIL